MTGRLYYLDSSVAIHAMDRTDARVVRWFDDRIDGADVIASSGLIRVEVTRYLRRSGRPSSDAQPLFDALAFAPVDDALVREAEAVEPYIKTLDTLHLATALRLGDALTALVSDDAKMLEVAAILGMRTYDPLAD